MSRKVANQQVEVGDNIYYAADNISAIGIVGVICFPLYYFVWHDWLPQPYENLSLRLIASLLCFFLIVYSHWPESLKKYLPIYWNICILYCLPFFFTFMMLKNKFSLEWNMSTLVSLFILMIVVTQWKKLFIMFLLGSLLAWGCFVLDEGKTVMPNFFITYLIISFFAVLAGSLFNHHYNATQLKFEKLQTLVAASGNVAHELRTPLLSIKSNTAGLEAYIPALLETYHQAKKEGLKVPLIRKDHEAALMNISNAIIKEVDYANTVIDMLLVSSNQKPIQPKDLSPQSIQHCIQTTLDRYPFNSDEDQQRVHWNTSQDFTFIGSDMLTVHILFNLLKNALYAISKANKGEITITTSSSEHYHHLHFRDTGPGITKENLSHIFERFYSTSKYGHGVGLSYCSMVMQSFNGNIECSSVENEYTEFQLNFPKETL